MENLDRTLRFINDNINNNHKNKKGKREKKLFELRKQVNNLFFNNNLTKTMIAKKKRVSRNFVIKWSKSKDLNFNKDDRGWIKGKRRKWDRSIEQKIKRIHQDLENDPHEFYIGATAIDMKWREKYPNISPPPLRTIGRMLSDLNLSKKRRRGRNRGAARYLCYPEHTIYHLLGGRVLEADFVGKKYIKGRTKPLNFIGFCFKKEPKLRYFRRIDGQSADNFIKQSKSFFKKFEKPTFMKIDNSLAMIGSASGKRNISRVMAFLFKNQVIPIFTVPRKPFSQASMEGNNSVFSRKFYNKIEFKNLKEVDEKLKWFNLSSLRYTSYKQPKEEPREKKDFVYKIYFIRQVREDKEKDDKAFINILNEKVFLPKSYINYFVLAEWNLLKERLYTHFEKEQTPKVIKEISFKINQISKRKYQKLFKK